MRMKIKNEMKKSLSFFRASPSLRIDNSNRFRHCWFLKFNEAGCFPRDVGCVGAAAEFWEVGANGIGNAGRSNGFVQHFFHKAKISTIPIIAAGDEKTSEMIGKAYLNSLIPWVISNSLDIG